MTNFNLRQRDAAQRHSRLTVRCAINAALLTSMMVPLAVASQGLRPSGNLGESRAARPSVETGQRTADAIAVVVNSEPITRNELRARLVRAEQRLARDGAALPSRQALESEVLESLIAEKAQLQVANETGVKVDEAAVDQAELTVARQNLVDLAELRHRLVRDGVSVSQFRENLRNQLLLERVREREVVSRVRVSELEIDQFISEKQGKTDAANLEINLAYVLIAVPENADQTRIGALQARADQVAARARAGEDFSSLVREFSDAPDRTRNGGQIGLRSGDRYPSLFIEATQQLGVGGIAGPVRSDAGFHVLKVVEKRQAGLPGATVTQSHVRHILLRPDAQLSDAAARERLAGFKRQITSGSAGFADLARSFSQDGSANEGGDLGWASPGQFVPEFELAMNALAPGQISEPLVSRFGVHLIQLVERREATLTQKEQREIVRNLVREKKLEAAFTTWAQDVRGRAYVEFRDPPQ